METIQPATLTISIVVQNPNVVADKTNLKKITFANSAVQVTVTLRAEPIGGPFTVDVSGLPTWITVTPQSGVVPDNGSVSLQVQSNPPQPLSANYSFTITVADNLTGNIQVAITVVALAAPNIQPNSHFLTMKQTDPPITLTSTLTNPNDGYGIHLLSATPSDEWISVLTLVPSDIPPQGFLEFQIRVDVANLPPGVHDGVVQLQFKVPTRLEGMETFCNFTPPQQPQRPDPT